MGRVRGTRPCPASTAFPTAHLGAAWALLLHRYDPLLGESHYKPNVAARAGVSYQRSQSLAGHEEWGVGWGGVGAGDDGGAKASGTPDPATGGGRGHPSVLRSLGRRAGKRRLLPAIEAFKKLLEMNHGVLGALLTPLPPLSPNALRQAREGFPPVFLHGLPCPTPLRNSMGKCG